uniref:Protein kinase domain-containing protein n=1 Tax=Macrostomum lignano TaxID=282301 RepID=A0A1I8IWX5_9PLAT
MERLQHPCVICLFEVIESVAKLHLVMEFAPGGELFTKIRREGRMAEARARNIFGQVAAAVEHMHSRHVVHRDLKAENVFFAGPRHVKVGDFGFSTVARPQQELHTFCGSPPYAAPELFRRESSSTYRGQPVDIWALGVLLFFMLAGALPFRAATLGRLRQLVLDGDFRLPAFISEPARQLVAALLQSEPDARPKATEVAGATWLTEAAAAERRAAQRKPQAAERPEEPPGEERNGQRDTRREERRRQRREAAARRQLSQLGIDERSLEEAAGSVRFPVGGAYRIALHRLCSKDRGKGIDWDDEGDEDDGETRRPRRQRNGESETSRTCRLL